MSELDGRDLSGIVVHDALLTGAKLLGVLLDGATIDGVITGLTVNGVEIEPLVTAELDRRHPERVLLRGTDPDTLRRGWAAMEAQWAATLDRVAALPAAAADERVEGEWSVTETLRHLVFVTDAWLAHAVLGDPKPYHPLGLVSSFLPAAALGLDAPGTPSLAEVLAARASRAAQLTDFLAGVSQQELDRVRPANREPGYPPPADRTALECVQVVLNEEWTHHQFAIRDLAVIEAASPP